MEHLTSQKEAVLEADFLSTRSLAEKDAATRTENGSNADCSVENKKENENENQKKLEESEADTLSASHSDLSDTLSDLSESDDEGSVFADLEQEEIETVYHHVKLGTQLRRAMSVFLFLLTEFRWKKGRGPKHRRKFLRCEKFYYCKKLLRGHSWFWFERLFRLTREELHEQMLKELPPRALETLAVEWIYHVEGGSERDLKDWRLEEADVVTERDEDTLERFSRLFERWAREALEALPEESPAAKILFHCLLEGEEEED